MPKPTGSSARQYNHITTSCFHGITNRGTAPDQPPKFHPLKSLLIMRVESCEREVMFPVQKGGTSVILTHQNNLELKGQNRDRY